MNEPWYNYDFCSNTVNTDNSQLLFSTDADVTGATNDLSFCLDPMIDWLPEACRWKKYWPIYHLKVSYNSA